jgi:hypothetical protein
MRLGFVGRVLNICAMVVLRGRPAARQGYVFVPCDGYGRYATGTPGLVTWLQHLPATLCLQLPGFIEASPGVRSLMVEYDMRVLTPAALLAALAGLDAGLPDPHTLTLPSRVLHLPLAFDDSGTRGAIEKYMKR